MMKRICCFCLALAVSGASALAAVVPGTPQDVFLRSLAQQNSAPEGIVYQVPDDKLEPGQLYHDVSADGDTRVTRQRVVGSVRSDANAEMNYDVTYRYVSKRGQTPGKLECTQKNYRIAINQTLSPNAVQTAKNFDLNVDTLEKYDRAVLTAHEQQHADDLEKYPIMFYFPAGDFRGRMSEAEEDELLNKIDIVENGYIEALKILEGRAVKAEVVEKKKQIDAERSSVSDGSQPLHSLFDLLFLGNERDISRQRWDNVSSAILAEKCILYTAKEDIKDRSDVSIGTTYEQAYEQYRNEDIINACANYEKKIVNLYQYFHNLQYKYDPNKKSIETGVTIKGGKVSRTKNDATYAINNFYEWLVEAERVLGELPQSCTADSCANRSEALFYTVAVRDKIVKGQELKDNEKIIAKVIYLRNLATPGFVGAYLLNKEFFIKVTEKKADVVEKFISLLSSNFNDNPLVEVLACMLVEEFPVGGAVYANKKRHAIFMNNGYVPKSHDTPDKRGDYKWNHYRQEIIKAMKEEYMETVNDLRKQAKRAREK